MNFFKKLSDYLKEKKTYTIVIIGILYLLLPVLTGEMSLAQFLQTDGFIRLLELLGLGGLRSGIKTAAKSVMLDKI